MRRRDGASGLPIKGRRRSTIRPKAHKAPTVNPSTSDLQDQLDRRTRERDEALEQQTATADVLKVISRSAFDLQTVLDTLVESATRLCDADHAWLFQRDGDVFRWVASFGHATDVHARIKKHFETHVVSTDRGSVVGRAALEARVVHVPDVLADPEYTYGEAQKVGGYRSALGVPLLHKGVVVGAIFITKAVPQPFSDKQIEVVTTFADQAVIAIENTRLFNELRQRTTDLSESLEQQTATSEVLKVISSTPGELEPVFQAMLENATRICEAKFGILVLSEGDAFRTVALHGAPPAFAEARRREPVIRPGLGTSFHRAASTREPVQIADIRAEPAYTKDPMRYAVLDLAGARTMLSVPMLKEDKLVGMIGIYRQEVRPFTDKQIDLVQNFAAQAVIAIENTRLLNELRHRTDDLSEALEQQTATSEVLKVISSSPGELEPVFNAMLENATRICGAKFGSMALREGDAFRYVAQHNAPPAWWELRRREPLVRPGPGTGMGQIALTKQVYHIADIRTERGYIEGDPVSVAGADLAGYRTLLVVPMMKEDELIGTINIYRQEVRPFTDKQIDLVKNFAAQAVIAIENTRLLKELRQRTDDLSEALEQQTATSDVLKVISSSPGELQPVFEAMLQNAVRICDAKFGNIYRWDGDSLRLIATHNTPPALARSRSSSPFRPGPETPTGRMVATKSVTHVADLAAERAYAERDPLFVEGVEVGGIRTLLSVPMLKENELIGAFTIYRQEVRPFTDKQIELVTTFADQAVIAIENARLLTETRDALEQQTATSEVLQVISASPGELKPVFQSMLENAVHLCEASFGNLLLYENDAFRHVALYNAPQAWAAEQQRDPIAPRRSAQFLYRVADTKQITHISDIAVENPDEPIAKVAGARTLLIVPMLKESNLIGVIAIYRQEVRPFSDKQIELVKNFASQAVIAIENSRLLNELRQRTDDLSEALEQQTATSEVLKVISSSPGELEPVFSAMLANATRICNATIGTLYLYEGTNFRGVALHHSEKKYVDYWRSDPVIKVKRNPGIPLERLVDTKQVVHIPDLRSDQSYIAKNDRIVSLVEVGGVRTFVAVPMLKEGELIGAINLYRQEVRPFTDKQIELVQNFASQAVIAIENTRLLSELRESLQQQTATANVLKVISSSPGELDPVFQAMLENATRICDARFGVMFRYDNESFTPAAFFDPPPALVEYIQQRRSFLPVPGTNLDRMWRTKDVVRVIDDSAEPVPSPAAKFGGARSLIAVPMLKEDALIGGIVIYRQEVRPFNDKQVELVSNFAAQAVIAIENTRLLNELRESLQQQTATADVLKVISRSTFDLQTVLDTLLESAVRLCEARLGAMFRLEEDLLHVVAHHNFDETQRRLLLAKYPMPPNHGHMSGRAILTGAAIQIPDVLADNEYRSAEAKEAGFRSLLGVPLLRNGQAIGSIVIFRMEVGPFTDKQLELIQTFADQAVIAIENTRLLNELRESLQQQTATAEVLKVISRSPGELEPVFNAMLRNAVQICGATFGMLFRCEDGVVRADAMLGVPPAFAEFWQRGPQRPSRRTALGRTIETKQTVHVVDVTKEPAYVEGESVFVAAVKLGGFRTILNVPMLKDNEVIGTLAIYRQEVSPFTDKQIDLVQNFAAQAVIAIENTRLLSELRESLQQQTATADVLKVISRSTFDLQPVLDTLTESAVQLCEADIAGIIRQKGDTNYWATSYGLSPEQNEYVKNLPIEPGRGTVAGRVLREGKTVHVPDVIADPEYTYLDAQKIAGYRSSLGVPLLREGSPIGVVLLMRRSVRPFTEKQIELVETFADQAVIAIENVRLFDEVQTRTRDLTESLQQQTATADVLKVISRSAFDLQTVLDALIESATRLCNADQGSITHEIGGVFFRAASYGYSSELSDFIRNTPVQMDRGSIAGRALVAGRIVQIPDVKADREYTFSPALDLGDFRTALGVPMLREGVPIGVLALTRKEVRPFTDKQIELVTTFADQAAIAIENVRLFESVETRTRELAKSLEDLRTAQDRLVQTEKLASLGQLTAGIAHEIKNPLNFVNNFSAISVELIDELRDALAGANLDNKLRGEISEIADMLQGNLDKVVQHGKRADSIVKNMLLHSRQGSQEHRPVDINAVVEESLNLAYHGARAEKQGFNITLERSLGSDRRRSRCVPAGDYAGATQPDLQRLLCGDEAQSRSQWGQL